MPAATSLDRYQVTHAAAHQAWYAAVNALFVQFKRSRADYTVMPAVTFVDPEVARVGVNEREAKDGCTPFEVTHFDFTLCGRKTHLEAIEAHLRKPGNFDDPRIHFAINCASIGCPMLRREAYTADRLDAQLDDQVQRFLSDHSRNRHAKGRLEVSKIFDWYAGDFSHGWHGITSVKQFLAAHAADLTSDQTVQGRIRAQNVPVAYLDYDWHLNESAKP